MVQAFADSAHIHVIMAMHAPGGVSVGDTAQGTMAHMNNPVLFALIRSKKWDFAVLQDNQGRFVRDSAVFSPASKVVQGHLNIMDSVKANNSCAKIILFGGWAWKYGSPPFGNTGIECINRILVNYCVLNDTMKEVIAPIGEAWKKAVNYLPSVNLWDTDDAHPAYSGSYLTAAVIFSSIFNLPTYPLNYSGAIAPATAGILRAFGDTSVFETSFHKKYNLGGVKKLSIVSSNGQLTVPGSFSNYNWYKNKAFVGTGATFAPQSNGTYRAELTEADGCILKTCNYSALTTGLRSEEWMQDVSVFPNPVKGGKLFIKSEREFETVELVNITGAKENISIEKNAEGISLSTSEIKPGCYLVVLTSGNQILHKKIVIYD